MKIDTRHPEYNKYLPKWSKVRDCVAGQDEVKAKGELYLPILGGQETKEYKKYLFRATFIEFTGRADEVAVSQVFRKPPAVGDIPQEILDNVDLKGTSFNYFWRQLESEILTVGRCGVLVDYEEKSQKRAYTAMYKSESIINWKTRVVNGVEKLSLVVLEGTVSVENQDDYTHEEEKRWKVLSLVDGIYTVSEYKQATLLGIARFVLVKTYQPEKTNNLQTEIPFYFVTAQGVTWELKNAPLLPMANLNLGDYINYADLENMLHISGVPTVIAKGRKDPKKSFEVGGVVDFDKEGDCKYMQASSDSGLANEHKNKVEMMAVLSASLLASTGRYVASAQTATVSTEGERATLSDISNAMTVSANQIMSFLMEWQENKEEYQTEIKFNTDFQTAKIDPQLLTSLMGALGSGTMSFETFYFNLKVAEMYPEKWTLEDEQKAIADYQEKKIKERDDKSGEQFNVRPGAKTTLENDGTGSGDISNSNA